MNQKIPMKEAWLKEFNKKHELPRKEVVVLCHAARVYEKTKIVNKIIRLASEYKEASEHKNDTQAKVSNVLVKLADEIRDDPMRMIKIDIGTGNVSEVAELEGGEL